MNSKWVKWVEVDSENIQKICYRNGKLFVVYAKSPNDVFVYNDVPEATMNRLYKAESIGSFINKVIKPKHKLATKLTSEGPKKATAKKKTASAKKTSAKKTATTSKKKAA